MAHSPITKSQTPSQPSAAEVDDPRAANRARFELELEFVQALANPFYLHTLSQQGILSQPAFVNYLEYLMYWKEKDYARFILCVSVPLLLFRVRKGHKDTKCVF